MREICSADQIISVGTDRGRIVLRIRVEAIELSQLKGFEEERNVDHTKVGVVARKDGGLAGGGDMTEIRELSLDLNNLPSAKLKEAATFPVSQGRASIKELNIFLDHNLLRNASPSEHIDHAAVSIDAGDGLFGGGDLTESRTIRLALHRLERVAPSLTMQLPVLDDDKQHGRIALGDLFELFRLWLRERAGALKS